MAAYASGRELRLRSTNGIDILNPLRLILFLLIPFRLFAVVLETDSVSDVLAFAGEGTLLVLDIDDTLIYYPHHLGSTSWFEEQWKMAEANGEEGIAHFHELAGLLAKRLDIAPVDPKTGLQLRRLQARGVPIVGLTGRQTEHPGIENWPQVTVDQLNSVGISFLSTAPRIRPKGVPLYQSGILFCNYGDKGKILVRFVEQLDAHPKCIVFIDDRLSDVQRVDAALDALGIRHLCFWFRGMEDWAAGYNPGAAADHLDDLLTN